MPASRRGHSDLPAKPQAAHMRISEVTILVMGSAWRNLTFCKLTTDDGLTGIS